ncbi:MAG: hypothetical protein IKD09_01325 [Lentisphaeria bacterium]|nr:hypothetical protein [Lentisphaeria bacterium]
MNLSKILSAAGKYSLAGTLAFFCMTNLYGKSAAEQARLEKLNSRERAVIWNNDGCEINEILFKPEKRTPEFFNTLRNAGVIGKNVDVISFCTLTSGFGLTTTRSKVAEPGYRLKGFGGGMKELNEKFNTDVLETTVKFAHDNNLECFWSFRINDCHDAHGSGESPLFPEFKKQNRDLLMGTPSKRPPYAYWSAVDFGQKKVRDFMFEMFKEIIDNYEIDGIDIDFCRHWAIFKSHGWGNLPSQQEMDGFTELMRRIRNYADEVGMKRNRPILMMIRILDSKEACRGMGLDIDRWCREGLVDIIAGGSEIRFNHPTYMAEWGKNYPNVKFYITATDAQVSGQHVLLRRNLSKLAYRSQANAAWKAGLNGVYSFNEYYPTLPHADYLKEISDKEALKGLNKCYYFSHSFWPAGRWGKNWDQYYGMPDLTPASPSTISMHGKTLELFMGDENPGAKYVLLMDAKDTVKPATMTASFNGVDLGTGKNFHGLISFDVPESAIKSGMNRAHVGVKAAATPELLFDGKSLLVFGANQGAWRRLYGSEGFVTGKSEKIVDGAMVIEDVTDTHFNNLAQPLEVGVNDRAELSFEAKVLPNSADGTAVVRVANYKFTETVEFRTNGIALKNAGKFVRLNTTGKFNKYVIELNKNQITVFVNGAKKLTSPMIAPFNVDEALVMGNSNEPLSWLNRNSIIVGSLSNEGKGGAAYKNMWLKNYAGSGRIFDGALMVIHDPNAGDLSPYFTAPLIDVIKDKEVSETYTLTTDNYKKEWMLASVNNTNLIAKDGKFNMKNQKAGPVIKHALPTEFDYLEISFKYKTLDNNTPKGQLQVATWAKHSQKDDVYGLYAYRLGDGFFTFGDNEQKKFPVAADGVTDVKIIIDAKKNASDIYINGVKEPIQRDNALNLKVGTNTVNFGDGTVAVEGECELFDVSVKVYGVKYLNSKIEGEPKNTVTLNAQNYKTWKISSVNNTNLKAVNGNLLMDSTKVGPILNKDFNGQAKLVEANVAYKVLPSEAKKAEFQFYLVLDSAKNSEKSNWYVFRLGDDYLCFADDPSKAITANADGIINFKAIIDNDNEVCEVYVNGAEAPILARGPLVLAKSNGRVVFGDGSSAVDGKCELISAEIKEYK